MATKAVLAYMQKENRPFSVNDIVQNLNKEFGKTAIQKGVDELVSQSKLLEKTYGKQKVYCITQEDEGQDQEKLNQEMAKMNKSILELTETLQGNERKIKNLEFELKNLKSSLTTEHARAEKSNLEKQVEQMKEKLKTLSENASPISAEQKQKVEAEHSKNVKEYRKRKRICNDIIESILEGYPKRKKDLIEELGVETDEEVNFKLENFN